MPWNRYETYQPSQYSLPKVDLGILANVLQAKQQRYDAAYQMAEELKNKQIDALQQDQALANKLTTGWQDEIDKIVSSYDGDYSATYRDINTLASKINREYLPGGQANAIAANKKAFTEAYNEEQKRLGKEINADQLNSWYNYYMNPNSSGYYKGIGSKDPMNGSYNLFNPERIVNYVNPDSIVVPMIDKLKADGFEVEQDQISGNWIMHNKQSGETLSPQDIYSTAYRTMANDPNYTGFLDQSAKFLNNAAFNAEDYMKGLAESYGNDYAYTKTKQSQTTSANPWALAQYREQNANNRALMRKQSEDRFFESRKTINYNKGLLDYSPNSLGKELTINDLTTSGDNYDLWASSAGIAPAGGVGAALGYAGSRLLSGVTTEPLKRGALVGNAEWGKRYMEKIISSGTFAKQGGNVNLMKSVIADAPDKITGTELLTRYNKAMREIGSTMESSTIKFDDPQVSSNLTNQMLKLQGRTMTTIRVIKKPGQKPVEIPYSEFKKNYESEMYDTKTGRLKDGYGITDMVEATAGIPPSFVLKVGDATVFMEAPPSYVQGMQDITDLTSQAYSSPNGIGEVAGLGDFAIPFVDPQTKQVAYQHWNNTPVRYQVTPVKQKDGTYRMDRTLYEEQLNPKTLKNEWKPIEVYQNDPYSGELYKVPLTLEYINKVKNNTLLPMTFGDLKSTSRGEFTDFMGSRYKGDYITNEE